MESNREKVYCRLLLWNVLETSVTFIFRNKSVGFINRTREGTWERNVSADKRRNRAEIADKTC